MKLELSVSKESKLGLTVAVVAGLVAVFITVFTNPSILPSNIFYSVVIILSLALLIAVG